MRIKPRISRLNAIQQSKFWFNTEKLKRVCNDPVPCHAPDHILMPCASSTTSGLSVEKQFKKLYLETWSVLAWQV